ncbi:unnamed protein product, partial [Ilex paraguariensis]
MQKVCGEKETQSRADRIERWRGLFILKDWYGFKVDHEKAQESSEGSSHFLQCRTPTPDHTG